VDSRPTQLLSVARILRCSGSAHEGTEGLMAFFQNQRLDQVKGASYINFSRSRNLARPQC